MLMIGLLLISQNMFAQAVGGTSEDFALGITQASNGGFAVAGYTESFGAGLSDALVFKLDDQGNIVWTKSFGGTSNDLTNSIAKTPDGGYVLAGRTESFGAGSYDLLLLKLDSVGNLLWAKTLGGTDYDWAWSIGTWNNDIAVAGYTRSFGAGSDDLLVLKIDSAGNLNWARAFGGSGDDAATSLSFTSDGGLAVAGYTPSFGAGNYDFLVLKLDSTGSLVWSKTFGGPGSDKAQAIAQTSDGGLVVVGYTNSFGAGNYDLLLLKLDSVGNLLWAKTLGGTNSEYMYSVIQSSDGGFAITGHTYSFGAGGSDLLLLKLDSVGNLLWAKTLGGTNSEYMYSVIQSSDGGFAITGHTYSFGAGGADVFLLKIGSDGNYSDCVNSCTLVLSTPNISTSSPPASSLTNCALSSSNPNLTVDDIVPNTVEICVPSSVEENETSRFVDDITCSSISGGLLVRTQRRAAMRIYTADGRLAQSCWLKSGKNIIRLDRGVYLWQAGQRKGKAVVR